MDNIQILRKLIDEDAITFLKANEKSIDAQFNMFLDINSTNNTIDINGREYVYGIDLSEGKDMTV